MIDHFTILKKLKTKIDGLKIPEHWSLEKVEQPNTIAKLNALNCCFEIYYKHNSLLPDRVACTKENGVYLVFEKLRSLFIETYNDGDVGALVCEGKNVLYNEDIVGFNFEKCMSVFNAEKTE